MVMSLTEITIQRYSQDRTIPFRSGKREDVKYLKKKKKPWSVKLLKARPSRTVIPQERAPPITNVWNVNILSRGAYLQSFDHFVGGDLVGDLLYPRRVSDLPVGTHDATESRGRLGLRGREVHPGGQLFFHSPLPASIGQKTKVQRERDDFVTSFFISKISNLQRALSPGRPGTRGGPATRSFPGLGSWRPPRRAHPRGPLQHRAHWALWHRRPREAPGSARSFPVLLSQWNPPPNTEVRSSAASRARQGP